MGLIFGLVKLVFVLVGLVVVAAVAGVVYVVAVPADTSQCPPVTPTSATAGSIGDALSARGVVDISNGDATAVGRGWVGSTVNDFRVCFDPSAGHASGELKMGPAKVPFYLSATGADLTGRHPQILGLSFHFSGLGMDNVPDFVAGPAQSMLTTLLSDNLGSIQLSKKYTSKFAEGKVTVQAQ
ncbi:MAG: hypothetical protein Q7O66_21205 [Dehalococcoidia bacterium]|nr:hypothetical protein [Dehalococcoidia bacterium]